MPRPALSVLQLDTRFPRIPGDVGCKDTYAAEVEIIRVPTTSVAGIVHNRPETIDIAPFEDALRAARGEIIVTSCGFLAPWQDHLAAMTERPVIASALSALDDLATTYGPGEILTVTFDASSLGPAHFERHAAHWPERCGLPNGSHLHRVISEDLTALDPRRAEREVLQVIEAALRPIHRHILLECTNLPPYRRMITKRFELPVTDILSQIEAAHPGTVQSRFFEP